MMSNDFEDSGIVLNTLLTCNDVQVADDEPIRAPVNRRNLEPSHDSFTHSVSHLIVSLEILRPDQFLHISLLEVLQQNSAVLRFLQNTANYWPETIDIDTVIECSHAEGVSHARIYSASMLVQITLAVSSLTYVIYNIRVHIDDGYFLTDKRVLALALAYCSASLDTYTILVAHYLNSKRLYKPAHIHDKTVSDGALRVAQWTLFVWILCVLVGGSVMSAALREDCWQVVVFLVLPGLFSSLSLAFNVYFLIMDLKVSSLLLDQMHILADKQSLKMRTFTIAREEIHRRVEASMWTSDLIAGPAAISVAGIAILSFNFSKLAIGMMLFLSRDFVFIAVAFWYVAKVNEKADSLTLRLSTNTWCSATDADLEERASFVQDIERLSIHASSISQPISFTLLFTRITSQQLVISAAGFVATFLTGVVKSAQR